MKDQKMPKGTTLKDILKKEKKATAPQRAADKAADSFVSANKNQTKSGKASLSTGIAIAAHKASGGKFPASKQDMNKAGRRADIATVKAAKKHGLKTKKHFKGPGSTGATR